MLILRWRKEVTYAERGGTTDRKISSDVPAAALYCQVGSSNENGGGTDHDEVCTWVPDRTQEDVRGRHNPNGQDSLRGQPADKGRERAVTLSNQMVELLFLCPFPTVQLCEPLLACV